MKASEKRMPPYLSAKRQLMTRGKELCRDGKALPPERELAKLLGVGRSTLRKAIDELICEAYIVNVPREGNFLTGADPRLQIAVVFRGFNVPYPLVLAGILKALGETPCWTSVLRVKGSQDIPELVRNYGLSAVVWLDPTPDDSAEISKLMDRGPAPLVAASPFFALQPDFALKHSCVHMASVGTLRAKLMLSRGHKRIIYAGKTGFKTYTDFTSVLAKAGIAHSPELVANDDATVCERIAWILDHENPTALVADGGPVHLEDIFKTVASHPKGANVELEVPDVAELSALRRRYPSVRIAGVSSVPYFEIGVAAGKMILEKLADGGKPKPFTGIEPELVQGH